MTNTNEKGKKETVLLTVLLTLLLNRHFKAHVL